MTDTEAQPEDAALNRALAMFAEAGREPKLTAAQVHALLFVASDTRIARGLDRLPTVSEIARATSFTHSGASRLMGSLLKEGLVLNDRGIMGSRSEAFVLTTRGKDRVMRLLEGLTAAPISDLGVHSFMTFAHSRYAQKEATGKMNVVSVGDDPRTFLVTPADDALSEEVRVWCENSLTSVPDFRVGRSGVSVEFKTENDAVLFRMKWG